MGTGKRIVTLNNVQEKNHTQFEFERHRHFKPNHSKKTSNLNQKRVLFKSAAGC